MSVLTITRHCESEHNMLMDQWNATIDRELIGEKLLATAEKDWKLTDFGRKQAGLVRLWRESCLPPANVRFSSSFVRAIETAQIIHGDQTPTVLEELHEWDWGVLNNRFPTEVSEIRKDFDLRSKTDPDARPPEGESFRDVYERIAPFAQCLLGMIKHQPNISIDVCCHYGVRRALMFYLRGWTFENYALSHDRAWKSNNGQVAVFYGNESGILTKMSNVSPAVEDGDPIEVSI